MGEHEEQRGDPSTLSKPSPTVINSARKQQSRGVVITKLTPCLFMVSVRNREAEERKADMKRNFM